MMSKYSNVGREREKSCAYLHCEYINIHEFFQFIANSMANQYRKEFMQRAAI